MSSASIRIAGSPLEAVGGWGELKWSTLIDGGLEQLSWKMTLPETFTHPLLQPGNLVQLKYGSGNIGRAILSEPDISEDGWEFTATGVYDDAHGYLCLDSGGDTTSVPDTAIDQAIADGWPVVRIGSLSSTAFAGTAETDDLNYLDDLLDDWATSQSKRIRINRDGQIIAVADPTTPTYYMVPGSARIGLADDDYVTDLYLRYRPTAGTLATVKVSATATGVRRKADKVDLTPLGVITSGKATAIGNGMLAKGAPRFAWTQAVNPSSAQLTTPGGQPVDLAQVRAGDLVRSFGVITIQGSVLPSYDWLIGRTEYEDGTDVIQLAPPELAARNLGDILALAVA